MNTPAPVCCSPNSIAPEWAAKIYDMLIEECVAPPLLRDDFIQNVGEGCREYRFQGALGFGGKFYASADEWRVDCYTEDVNEERRRKMRMANLRLANMRGGMETQTTITQLRQQLAEVERERDEARIYLRWFCSNLKWFTFMKTRGCHDYQVEIVAALIGEKVPDVKDVGQV